MVCKIFAAEILEKKRRMIRLLNFCQIILLLLNILTLGFMMTSGVYNVRAGDQYSQYAGTKGNTTALLDNANDTNNLCNTYEGVSDPLPSPQSFGCR